MRANEVYCVALHDGCESRSLGAGLLGGRMDGNDCWELGLGWKVGDGRVGRRICICSIGGKVYEDGVFGGQRCLVLFYLIWVGREGSEKGVLIFGWEEVSRDADWWDRNS